MQIKVLEIQSNLKYNLVRVISPRMYYIERKFDNFKTELLTHDQAENYILYGLTNKECELLSFYK